MKDGSGPDRNMADFFWCMMASQRGWSIEETAHKQVEVSARAQERMRLRDEGYALVTAQNAAAGRRTRTAAGQGMSSLSTVDSVTATLYSSDH
jgi:hypothetical protein